MYGPFGNLFPYADQHALNLDWIIQVAKDFLDQYTHIQDIISNGEESLDQHTADGLAALAAEKDRLEGLLNAWYLTHSNDIANQLTAAVASFQTSAEAIGATVIASIPVDYTQLEYNVDILRNNQNSDCVTSETIEFTFNNASSINPATGANGAGINGCRSSYISYNKPIIIKTDLSGYTLTVWAYSNTSASSAVYSPTGSDFVLGEQIIYLKPITGTNPCFRIGLQNSDGTSISSELFETLISKISFFTMTDGSLTKTGVPADAKATGDLMTALDTYSKNTLNQMLQYNSVDALFYGNGSSRTDNGITYTRNSNGTWTLNGTATDTSVSNIVNSADAVPGYIIPGKTYVLKFDGTITPIRVYYYFSDSSRNTHINYTENNSRITIPNDITGIIIRFQIASGTAFSNETIGVHLISEQASGGTTIYEITASPTITTDTHNWLEPAGDTTDMVASIMTLLSTTGYCKLAPGTFYVEGNLDIPSGATLEGCGKDTIIRLADSVASGYAVKIKNYATVQNLSIIGSGSALTPSGSIGTRHGIVFEAAYGQEEGNETSHCMVNNVWIENFTGAGIRCYRTSINYAKGLYVEQAFINRCHTGIDIEMLSEFNKFVNVCMARCYNACVNNGGNNVFSSCTFHATHVGLLMDDSDSTHGNNGHGTATGCTFCHIGSNTGSAITANNIINGFVFNACQVWYNSIDLTDCEGFIFNSIEFGKGVNTNKGAAINIDGGKTIMFNGCVFMNDVTNPPEISITNNLLVKFNNCYGSVSGDAITGS